MLKIIDEIVSYIDDRAVKADYTISGTTYPAKISKSIVNGDTVRKHIYLTHNDPIGTVTSARLLGEDGKVIAERTDQQVHEKNKGLLLEFKFTIQEV
ncbi:hemolysin [Virgibacillus halodenitrificans]|uniref:hemolysin n=1 Tax=Virgibacillus halodenitrificans TaxID=1482 RepID=UPI00136E731C|nr:hemolysin [Virgibacillus halodenitrificans]MYL45065.1 hemolysin [Virgibacillus halodenitrificans]